MPLYVCSKIHLYVVFFLSKGTNVADTTCDSLDINQILCSVPPEKKKSHHC